MTKNTVAVLGCTLLLLAGMVILSHSHTLAPHNPKVIVGGQTFAVEIADTDFLREKGLSGHAPFGNDQGMLFVFSHPGDYSFWMKDMLFPLDIIWIGPDWRITHIERSLATSTYPQTYHSDVPSQYVLEVSANTSDNLGLKEGDIIQFLKK